MQARLGHFANRAYLARGFERVEHMAILESPHHPESLVAAVETAFAPNGQLARNIEGFRARSGQFTMAQSVAKVIQDGGVLAVEAGTGVGKTLAYLIPTLLSGGKVLISTATKNLQEQLYLRDLPQVLAALGFQVSAALLKGRSSYLCAQRLSQVHLIEDDLSLQEQEVMRGVRTWAHQTVHGDVAEFGDLEAQPRLINLVTSSRENCLGGTCPHIQNCHIGMARQRAMQADVVVVNHHLFFADVNVRASGVAELLPNVDTVIFDEAHRLSDVGVQFLGRRWTTGQAMSLSQHLAGHSGGPVRAMADWLGLAADLMRAADCLRALLPRPISDSRRPWTGSAPQDVPQQLWQESLQALLGVLEHALHTCIDLEQVWPGLQESKQRCQAMGESLQAFLLPRVADQVRWIEFGSGLSLHEAPLTIAPFMRLLLAPKASLPGTRPKSWIFTSATLGTDEQLSWFVRSCGLLAHQVLQVPSPFDYAQQAALYIPIAVPLPSHPDHSASVAALVAQGARVLGGRTLVLTTTLRAMRAIAQGIQEGLEGSGIKVLVQGQLSKRLLIQQYLRSHGLRGSPSAEHHESGSVLVASASFWEGVDIPGDALQLVVIDKLPFPPPDDPLVQARALAFEKPFTELYLPDAALALKQGAGRLIRGERDRGVLVVCDGRLAAKGYGKRLLAALPTMRRLPDESQWLAALAALTAERQESFTGPGCEG